MAPLCREQKELNLLHVWPQCCLCTESGVQVMLGRREAVTLLLVDGRAKDTLETVPLLK